ncbi:MAG: hypothetical protein UR85_C0007G0043 [Candidatus Nomurabacteria bacterium GW2011_GWF2_35_66]|uniref:Uncharacterized protein n=1 Tax=Candidatus Nomurabacteria bacterium GW2011_GWE1_35_16 TaxID=1618761 RepID=A0A0G0EGB6_9BACT|nr:MAG: hypothetical protein UR55_C0009G0016 [Candidatus Nomurabacteria bacterium GW2011_GWF1_34_20]KKP62973.1 MAG: hypothetical protein UR57_C0009G0016 [Candidatus Nomurabacteria bacterium GW2011_GWE2_34_25]KKP66377.1 MAG: hypothetical protein UR64_C0008G0015 [Candidatus Nomurabacteria bacterium GW2011_GWE1_35_16]KKP83183.1 MAG: hypothetical protein UR85_C0007G0043 [Candidatus Nomurabacteria bacterium GW2011_GWF2_35_66]HAE36530.1 hypothetical protein [Candidatus Nomurabacteria bacterium]
METTRTFSSLSELGEETLRSGDLLLFPGYKYLVAPSSLLNEVKDGDHDAIFIFLKIEDKYKFCEDIYGYPSCEQCQMTGQFPPSQEHDYESLTKLAKEFWILFQKRKKVFRSSKDFKNREVVKLNDEFIIDGMEYVVWSNTLFRKYAKDPNKIFKTLLIWNGKEYCDKRYKYSMPSTLGFPNYKEHDYIAATSVIISFMRRWERWSFFFKFVNKYLR